MEQQDNVDKRLEDDKIPTQDVQGQYQAHGTRGHIKFIQVRNIIYYILGIVETLLLFRLLFKLLGANPGNAFVSLIYSATRVLSAPFLGIFKTFDAGGIQGQTVLEPSTIIAMVVYAVVARGLISLARIKYPQNVY